APYCVYRGSWSC
nr:Chain E, APY peptide [synthetic construct]4W50_F Chain F, APY peptide [synthetic construct]4W50_G Chain G, APY peptide [synthetic construct]4W50_H Chain H, APY peptide [synthetic construct]